MAESTKTASVPLSVLLPAGLNKRVNDYAKRYSLNRTAAVIMLLGLGLENQGQTAIDVHGTPEEQTP